MTYRVAFLTCSHNRYTLGVIAFTLCGYVFFLIVYPCVAFMANIFEPNMYMVPVYMVWNGNFWICIFAVPMIGWSVDICTSWAKHVGYPDAVDELKLDDDRRSQIADDECPFLQENIFCDPSESSVEAAQRPLTLDGGHVDCSPYAQQELKSWRIKTTSRSAIRVALCCGLALFGMGFLVRSQSKSAAQLRVIYQMAAQGETWLASEIPWGTLEPEVTRPHQCHPEPNAGFNMGSLTCNVRVPRTMTPPLLVYYGVGPFYQNIVDYIKSEVSKELMGQHVDNAIREAKCRNKDSREQNGKQIVPCGTKAATLFNDTLELVDRNNGKRLKINKTGVAWNSDVNRYKNPTDYCNRTDTTWLYEQFPEVVSKEEGVKSEAFAAWMRPAALGRVWNQYGWLEETLQENDTITFKINSSFNATNESSKFFAITERNIFGGRNNRFGTCLMVAGAFCLFLSLAVWMHSILKR